MKVIYLLIKLTTNYVIEKKPKVTERRAGKKCSLISLKLGTLKVQDKKFSAIFEVSDFARKIPCKKFLDAKFYVK